jgi:hypothetical protein
MCRAFGSIVLLAGLAALTVPGRAAAGVLCASDIIDSQHPIYKVDSTTEHFCKRSTLPTAKST